MARRISLCAVCAAIAGIAGLLAAPAGAAAPPNPFFGVDALDYPTQPQLNRVAAAGAGTFRVQLSWAVIEPTAGTRVFADLDRLVAMTSTAGLTLLPDLYGVPSWISRDPSTPPIHGAEQQSGWRALLGDLARRYGSNGTFWLLNPTIPRHPITTWEIWNEPNLGGFFGGKPNARAFARLLKLSSDSLRAADPAARVVTGGIFPYHTLRHTVDMVSYLKALYRVPGVTNYFDGLGLHPYSTTPKLVLHWVRVARRIMGRHGDSRTPIWVTEFGWVTGGARFKFSPLRSTFAQQAHRLTATYRLFRQNAGPLGIAAALWFSLADHHTVPGPDFWIFRAGLFKLNGRPKPAWYAFARVAGGHP